MFNLNHLKYYFIFIQVILLVYQYYSVDLLFNILESKFDSIILTLNQFFILIILTYFIFPILSNLYYTFII